MNAYFLFIIVYQIIPCHTELNSNTTLLVPKMDDKCKHIKCSTEEDPRCVKIKHVSKKEVHYVVVINKCELRYMDCHQDYVANIVPMSRCLRKRIMKTALTDIKQHTRVKRRVGIAGKRRAAADSSSSDSDGDIQVAVGDVFNPKKIMNLKEYDDIKQTDESDDSGAIETLPKEAVGKSHIEECSYMVGVDCSVHIIETVSKDEYEYFPVGGTSFEFKVKTLRDAHIALTTRPEKSIPWTMIIIGGWSNTWSIIEINKETKTKTEEKTPNILNKDGFRGFQIRWDGGTISVRREGEEKPFMSLIDPEPFPVSFIGVRSSQGATGSWKLEVPIKVADDSDGTDNDMTFELFSKESINKRKAEAEHAVDYELEDCPDACPTRNIMICALSSKGVYHTFQSSCHLRNYVCKKTVKETFQLVARRPCVMSAPWIISPGPENSPKVLQQEDRDVYLNFFKCRSLGILGKADPRCPY